MVEQLAIEHDLKRRQFAIASGEDVAYLAYMDLGQRTLDIYRTFVPLALRGKGIAAALTRAALDFAKEEDYRVIASCSYVERFIERAERHQALS
ncbi:GNAT family N-acetyltransferase [Atopomonas sediminilitoris]|uniref:GNAT family N-acetyltransferase n=1 Tax=Atopomonas sediminilitoris TaxID=2919919 RepID=UPI002342E53A|nr:GNAT family N-acetyltransferase [Atopomonas sediminilitoris]